MVSHPTNLQAFGKVPVALMLIPSNIYIFVPVSGHVGREPSALVCQGAYNAVKTALWRGGQKVPITSSRLHLASGWTREGEVVIGLPASLPPSQSINCHCAPHHLIPALPHPAASLPPLTSCSHHNCLVPPPVCHGLSLPRLPCHCCHCLCGCNKKGAGMQVGRLRGRENGQESYCIFVCASLDICPTNFT